MDDGFVAPSQTASSARNKRERTWLEHPNKPILDVQYPGKLLPPGFSQSFIAIILTWYAELFVFIDGSTQSFLKKYVHSLETSWKNISFIHFYLKYLISFSFFIVRFQTTHKVN